MGSVDLLPAVRASAAIEPRREGPRVVVRVGRVSSGHGWGSDPGTWPFRPRPSGDLLEAYLTAGVPGVAPLVDLFA